MVHYKFYKTVTDDNILKRKISWKYIFIEKAIIQLIWKRSQISFFFLILLN